VREAGYTGDIEVEIFNADIWAADGDQVLATMARRFVDLVLPSAELDQSLRPFQAAGRPQKA
jgi:hypothetical protein